MTREKPKNLWLSRWGFILAATGSAVGLGNIWKFPYITGEYGGGAFVLMYLACILAIGIPVMMTEIAIGRRGRGSPIDAIGRVVRENGGNPLWKAVGGMAMLAGFMILCFYVVVAGWAFAYTWKMLDGSLAATSVEALGGVFEAHNANPWQLGGWSVLVALLTLWIVAKGVQKGIENAVRWMMPGLALMLVALVGYAFTSGSFSAGFGFLFHFDASKITGEALLAALGHAFFTLSLASGAILTYGSYIPDGQSIARTTFVVALCDTCVALLAGLAIFPIVISFGISPEGGGPGLIFTSLPLAFEAMPGGIVYGLAFFALLFVAAWTSSISLLEPATAYMVERGRSRRSAALMMAGLCWALGLVTVFSFNIWSHVRMLDRDLMGLIELVANDIMLPLGGLLIALFAGWVLKDSILREQLAGMPAWGFTVWRWLLRVLCPLLVLAVLLNALL